VFAVRAEELIEGRPELVAAIRPLLEVRNAVEQQVSELDRKVIKLARQLGTEPSWDLMQGCDTLLMVGTGFPWSEFLPKDGAARAVQIDIEASMLSLRYPADVNLHGDAAATLKALLPLIRRKDDREWSKTVEDNVAAWWKKLEGRAMAEAKSRQSAARRSLRNKRGRMNEAAWLPNTTGDRIAVSLRTITTTFRLPL
jgi:hypothetical protein